MLELHVKDPNVQSGVAPITWCLDPETARMVRKHFKDPHLLLIIAPERNYHMTKERRRLVRLKDGMAYVDFRHAGANNVFAIIVDGKRSRHFAWCYLNEDGTGFRPELLGRVATEEELEATEMLREAEDAKAEFAEDEDAGEDGEDGEDGEIEEDAPTAEEILRMETEAKRALAEARERAGHREDETLWKDEVEAFLNSVIERSAVLRIMVPDGVFAKEPPQWLKNWANWLFLTEPADQCAFRRRVLLTPLTLPFFILVCAIRTLVAGILLGVGIRGVNLSSLRHPLHCDTETIWDDLSAPYWLPLEDGDSVWRFLLPPTIPLLLIGASVSVMFFGGHFGLPEGWLHLLWLTPVISFAVVVGLVVLIGLFVLIVMGVGELHSTVFPNWAARHAERRERARREVDHLVCRGGDGFRPPPRRTAYLIYQNVKAKVCKPFSA